MAKSRINQKLDRFGKYFAVGVLVTLGAILQIRWVAKHQGNANPFSKVEHVKRAQCSHCNGRGKVPFFFDPSELRECPICYGAGARLVKINPEFQQPCPSCFGMGRLYNTDTHHGVPCFTCMGRGAILRGDLQPAGNLPPAQPGSTTNTAPAAMGDNNDV